MPQAHHVSLSDDQLAEARDVFNYFDRKGDEKINVIQVGDVLRALGQNPTEADITKCCDHWKDKDMRITFEDFLPIYQGINKSRQPVSPDEFVEGLSHFDKEGNGQINVAELRHLLTTLGERLTDEEVEQLLHGQEDSQGNVNISEFMTSSGAHATPKDARIMAAILKDAGVQEYEPRVISQMLEFAYKYTCDILDDARVYSEHAGKRVVDNDDVKMSISNYVETKFTTPPPKQMIADLAKEKNSQPLPTIKQHYGLHLPPDRYSLIQPNYKLNKDTTQINSGRDASQSSSSYSSMPTNPLMSSVSTNPLMSSVPVTLKRKIDEDYDNY